MSHIYYNIFTPKAIHQSISKHLYPWVWHLTPQRIESHTRNQTPSKTIPMFPLKPCKFISKKCRWRHWLTSVCRGACKTRAALGLIALPKRFLSGVFSLGGGRLLHVSNNGEELHVSRCFFGCFELGSQVGNHVVLLCQSLLKFVFGSFKFLSKIKWHLLRARSGCLYSIMELLWDK